ncbi:unnamed protein product, partial [Symbiodinium microadriaticum]
GTSVRKYFDLEPSWLDFVFYAPQFFLLYECCDYEHYHALGDFLYIAEHLDIANFLDAVYVGVDYFQYLVVAHLGDFVAHHDYFDSHYLMAHLGYFVAHLGNFDSDYLMACLDYLLGELFYKAERRDYLLGEFPYIAESFNVADSLAALQVGVDHAVCLPTMAHLDCLVAGLDDFHFDYLMDHLDYLMDRLDYLLVLDYLFVRKLAFLGAGFLRWEIVEIHVAGTLGTSFGSASFRIFEAICLGAESNYATVWDLLGDVQHNVTPSTTTTTMGEMCTATTWAMCTSTTTSTSSSASLVEGDLGDYSPDATVEEMQTLTLQELADQELLGGANQSGQLLMELHQQPADFAVVVEPPPNRPATVDWTHDLLHNLAQRVLDETIGAQRYGHPPTVRWGAHVAAAEFRDAGRMLMRLADMIVNSIDRPVDEPRTTPPSNEPMHCHYRDWSRRWRDMLWVVIRELIQHEDAEALAQQTRLRERDAHFRRMEELRELERFRTPVPPGPEPGLGVPVARRPTGAVGRKRTHAEVSEVTTTPASSSTAVPPRPKFRMPEPSVGMETVRPLRPQQTPDVRPRPPPPPPVHGPAVASRASSSWERPDNVAGPCAWNAPLRSLHPSGMNTTLVEMTSGSSLLSMGTGGHGGTSSVWDHHNNPGTPTIPPVPVLTACTPVTPFDDRGVPIPLTPTIPSAPVITSATPVTPFFEDEDVPDVGDVLEEICGGRSSTSTTSSTTSLVGWPSSSGRSGDEFEDAPDWGGSEDGEL